MQWERTYSFATKNSSYQEIKIEQTQMPALLAKNHQLPVKGLFSLADRESMANHSAPGSFLCRTLDVLRPSLCLRHEIGQRPLNASPQCLLVVVLGLELPEGGP